jgi:hypothetical protein
MVNKAAFPNLPAMTASTVVQPRGILLTGQSRANPIL